MHIDKMKSSPPRRRSRTEFVQVVSKSLERLQSEHGYSRERATQALLQEILSAAFGGEQSAAAAQPSSTSDGEYQRKIYDIMKQHGMSFNQAHHALEVSRAIEELCRKHPEQSAWQVLQALTQRLENARLLEHGATTMSPTTADYGETSSLPTPHIAPPTAGLPRPNLVRTMSSATKKPKAASAVSSGSSTKPSNHRKRSFLDSNANNSNNTNNAKPSSTRPRCNSVTEQVSAKLASDASSAASGANTTTTTTTASSTKTKRPHLDESSSSVMETNKRARLGSAATSAAAAAQQQQQPHE